LILAISFDQSYPSQLYMKGKSASNVSRTLLLSQFKG